jgi:hypothetical protein
MRKLKPTLLILFLVIALLGTFTNVQAIPPLPSSFYGTVKQNGENLPEGTVVQALIDDAVVVEGQTMMYQGESVYSIDVPGDDTSTKEIEGGTEGSEIHFRVGDLEVNETAIWMSGTNVELDLSISSDLTPKQAQPTKTPIPTQTPINIPTNSTQQQSALDPTISATVQPTSGMEAQAVPGSEKTESDFTQVAEVVDESNAQSDQTVLSEQDNPSTNLEESTSNSKENQEVRTIQFWLILIISVVIGIALIIIFLLRKKSKNRHEDLLF